MRGSTGHEFESQWLLGCGGVPTDPWSRCNTADFSIIKDENVSLGI